MTETAKAPPSNWEREYYEDIEASFQDQGVVIQGGIYDSRSLQNALWNKQRLANRAHNTSLAHGRVNGQYLEHGNKR